MALGKTMRREGMIRVQGNRNSFLKKGSHTPAGTDFNAIRRISGAVRVRVQSPAILHRHPPYTGESNELLFNWSSKVFEYANNSSKPLLINSDEKIFLIKT